MNQPACLVRLPCCFPLFGFLTTPRLNRNLNRSSSTPAISETASAASIRPASRDQVLPRMDLHSQELAHGILKLLPEDSGIGSSARRSSEERGPVSNGVCRSAHLNNAGTVADSRKADEITQSYIRGCGSSRKIQRIAPPSEYAAKSSLWNVGNHVYRLHGHK